MQILFHKVTINLQKVIHSSKFQFFLMFLFLIKTNYIIILLKNPLRSLLYNKSKKITS